MRITEVLFAKGQRVEYMEHFAPSPFMQNRSQIILLKVQGLSLNKIAERLSCSEPKVNRWVNIYMTEGVDGLRNR